MPADNADHCKVFAVWTFPSRRCGLYPTNRIWTLRLPNGVLDHAPANRRRMHLPGLPPRRSSGRLVAGRPGIRCGSTRLASPAKATELARRVWGIASVRNTTRFQTSPLAENCQSNAVRRPRQRWLKSWHFRAFVGHYPTTQTQKYLHFLVYRVSYRLGARTRTTVSPRALLPIDAFSSFSPVFNGRLCPTLPLASRSLRSAERFCASVGARLTCECDLR